MILNSPLLFVSVPNRRLLSFSNTSAPFASRVISVSASIVIPVTVAVIKTAGSAAASEFIVTASAPPSRDGEVISPTNPPSAVI